MSFGELFVRDQFFMLCEVMYACSWGVACMRGMCLVFLTGVLCC